MSQKNRHYHPKNAMATAFYGDLCRLQGNLEKAEEYYTKSLGIYQDKKCFDFSDHNEVAWVNTQLGITKMHKGETGLDEAKLLFKSAKKINRDVFGKSHVTVGISCVHIGNVYLTQNNVDHATKWYNKAKVIFDEAGFTQGKVWTRVNLEKCKEDSTEPLFDVAKRICDKYPEIEKEEIDSEDFWNMILQ